MSSQHDVFRLRHCVHLLRGWHMFLFMFLGAFIAIPTQAQVLPDDVTYLYYFESDDARLIDSTFKRYAFAPLPNEVVTMVAYGLDERTQPIIRLYNANGTTIANSTINASQPFVASLEYRARENGLLFFEVERVGGEGGLVRVMLFEGEPLDQDLTFLDDMNPLLPNRAFMVAGRDDEEGLRVLVEVLDVPFSRVKPQVFASRGTLSEIPTPEERFTASDAFLWYNQDGQAVYFVHVRPTPEETTETTRDISYSFINISNFFYFDYYFTVGAGSDPIRLLDRDECSDFVNRAECVNTSSSFGRETDAIPVPNEEDEDLFEDELPEVLPCDNGAGINVTLTAPGVLAGTECDDTLTGSSGDDVLRGGPGDDFLDGQEGNDLLIGDEGDDVFITGNGNDIVQGGDGSDTINYASDTGGIGVDLTNTYTPTGTMVSYTNAFGSFVDTLLSIENIVTGSGNDFLVGNSENNILNGGDGNDTFEAGGGTNTIIMGEGDDFVIIDTDQITNILGSNTPVLGSDNDIINFSNGASGIVTFTDSNGEDRFDFSNLTLYGIIYNLGLALTPQQVTPDLVLSHRLAPPAFLIGTILNDFIIGSAGNDGIFLENGDDQIEGSGGSDTLNGGADFDVLTYQGLPPILAGINANLLTGIVVKGSGSIDTVSGFEVLVGSMGNDTLVGNDADNTIVGLAGNDIMDGGAGYDYLSYELFNCANVTSTGVNLNILNGTTAGEGADSFSNFEGYVTTNCQDIITTGDNNDEVYAQNGNDTVFGSLGNDVIDGEGGRDNIVYKDIAESMNFVIDGVTASAEGTVSGFVDTLNNFEVFGGSDLSDTWLIENGICPPSLCGIVSTGNPSQFLTLVSGFPLFVDTYNFETDIDGNILGEGYILIQNNVTDIINAPINQSLTSQWQQIGANLYIKIANVLNANCLSAGQNNFVNGTTNPDLLGTGATQLATCPSNEIFNGFEAITPVFIPPFNFISPTNPFYSDYDVVSYQDVTLGTGQFIIYNIGLTTTVTGGGGISLGTDQLINIEGITGNALSGVSNGTDRFNFSSTPHTLIYFLNGLGGNDTLNFDTVFSNVTINASLLSSTPDTVGYHSPPPTNMQNIYNNVTIGLLSYITNILGGFGNDTITGTPLDDTITGNFGDDILNGAAGNDLFIEDNVSFNGNDTINGGSDSDTVLYNSTGSENLVVDLTISGDTVTAGSMVDTLINIFQITTGLGADTFNISRGGGEFLESGGGNDIFNIAVGNSMSLLGGNGIDNASYNGFGDAITVTLNNGNGTVTGTALNNNLISIEQLVGTAGNDLFNQVFDTVANVFRGQGGIDAMNYGSSAANLTVNMRNGNLNTTLTNGVTTDTISGFEVLTLGIGSDTVTVTGDGGWSTINLNGGNDTLIVNANSDNTTYNGDAGVDSLYHNLMATWTINGTTLNALVGAFTDTFNSFENIFTSAFSDLLNIGSTAPYGTIDTGAGADRINLISWDSTDFTYEMGAGNDAVNTSALSNTFDVTIDNTTITLESGGQTDTFLNTENAFTGGGNDTFTVVDDTGLVNVNSGGGDDTFFIDANNQSNTFDGGTGIDSIEYDASLGSLDVNIGANVMVLAGIQTDTLIGFEEITANDGDHEFFIDLSNVGSSITFNTTNGISTNLFAFLGDISTNANATLATPITVEIETASGANDTLDFSGVTGTNGITLDMGSSASQDVFGLGTFFIKLINAINTITATENDDVIFGTDDDDTINAGGGNDTVNAGAGDDTVNGGAGNDTIDGEDDDDTLNGDEGDDFIDGSEGDDLINGGDDNDTLYGCQDNDTLNGDDGDDEIYGGCDNTTGIVSEDGEDIINGGAGNDTIYGGNNNGGANIDADGNDGNDIITGGTGNDTVYGGNDNTGATLTTGGGAGDDEITVDDDSDADTAFGGNDGNQGDAGTNTINDGAGDTVDNGNAP